MSGTQQWQLSLRFERHASWPPHLRPPPASSLPPPAPVLLAQLALLRGGAPDRGPWTTEEPSAGFQVTRELPEIVCMALYLCPFSLQFSEVSVTLERICPSLGARRLALGLILTT